MVYFKKMNINESTGSATIIVTNAPMTQKATDLCGLPVASRTQGVLSFGVLSLLDPETNKTMGASHPTIVALTAKLNAGDEMPKFKLSDVKVVNLVTGEENENLYWVEQV